MENGARGVSEVDAAIYLTFCGVLRDELDELLGLARAGDDETWLQEHGQGMPDELRTLVYHETTAITMASYEPLLVPGLLQTEGYARSVFEFADVVSSDRIGTAVQARLSRQTVLRKLNPPQCLFFLHEAALRAQVGTREVMQDQLFHLVFLSGRPQHEIRVVPASAGPHGVWFGPFMLMGYEAHGPVVCVESLTNSLFLEKPRDIEAYTRVLKRLDRAALDAGQSRELLAKLASDLDQPEDKPHEHA